MAKGELRALQAVVVAACAVPIGGGMWGVLGGVTTRTAIEQSQVRYLSGLLVGIGLSFLACVPTLERRGREVRMLAAIVAVGGLARLWGLSATGAPMGVVLPLVMELGVTVAVALWRERVERGLAAQSGQG